MCRTLRAVESRTTHELDEAHESIDVTMIDINLPDILSVTGLPKPDHRGLRQMPATRVSRQLADAASADDPGLNAESRAHVLPHRR